MANSRKKLIVGIGNPLRGDDGVGPIIANQIETKKLPEVETLTVHQLLPELAARLSQFAIVVFVDAIQFASPGAAPELRRITGEFGAIHSSHQLTPTRLLALAKTVSGYRPDAWLLTVPVARFDVAEKLSRVAIANSKLALKLIQPILIH